MNENDVSRFSVCRMDWKCVWMLDLSDFDPASCPIDKLQILNRLLAFIALFAYRTINSVIMKLMGYSCSCFDDDDGDDDDGGNGGNDHRALRVT